MPIRLLCPACATTVQAADELRGRMVRCPKCRETFPADEQNAPRGVQQAPGPKPKPRPYLDARRPAAPVVAKRPSRAGVVIGVSAAVVLLLPLAVASAVWMLWPRPAAAPASDSTAAVAPPDGPTPAGWKGPQWTTDLDKMKLLDDPAAGWVMGTKLKVEEATLSPFGGGLTLRQGKQFAPGAYLTLRMGFNKSLADLEGKTFTVSGKQAVPGMIWAQLGRTAEGEKLPKMQMYTVYTMKLEFGKGEGLKLPGKVYICFPDEANSVIAGKFLLEGK